VSLVAFREVSVVYLETGSAPAVTALSKIDLELAAGDFVTVIGHSGCGKTSMLNLIAGFVSPTQGRVELEGQPITGPGVERGVVFQRNALMPWLDVADNVGLGLTFKGVPAEARQKRIAECLVAVGLQDFAKHRVYDLSGGMQQRVGLARALAADPKILLMDEPLGALDAFTRETVQELVLRLWKSSGKLIVFITHSIEEALFLGSRLVVMTPRPGRIDRVIDLGFGQRYLEEGNVRAVKSSPEFIAMREQVLGWIQPQEVS